MSDVLALLPAPASATSVIESYRQLVVHLTFVQHSNTHTTPLCLVYGKVSLRKAAYVTYVKAVEWCALDMLLLITVTVWSFAQNRFLAE